MGTLPIRSSPMRRPWPTTSSLCRRWWSSHDDHAGRRKSIERGCARPHRATERDALGPDPGRVLLAHDGRANGRARHHRVRGAREGRRRGLRRLASACRRRRRSQAHVHRARLSEPRHRCAHSGRDRGAGPTRRLAAPGIGDRAPACRRLASLRTRGLCPLHPGAGLPLDPLLGVLRQDTGPRRESPIGQSGPRTMSALTGLTLVEARAGLAAKRFSATELTTAFLEAIAAGNKSLNAYVLPTPDHALAQAKISDGRYAKG